MEDIAPLTQKQRKRRLRAVKDCIDIVQDVLDNLKDKKQMLLAAVDVEDLNETPNKHLSINQLDDWIKCYSQTYAELSQAQGMVQKLLTKVINAKKEKEAAP